MNPIRAAILCVMASSINAPCAFALDLGRTLQVKNAVLSSFEAHAPSVVIVDQQAHMTHVFQLKDDVLCDVFTIPNSTGKPSTPTPNCRAKIVQKELNPSWTPPVSIDPNQKVIPPYSKTHRNPLGLANLRLNVDHGMIALHGTNEPKRIGQNVSHGCIRHRNQDIVQLYNMVHVGTPVYIVPNSESVSIPLHEFQNQDSVAKHNGSSTAGVQPRILSAI